MDDLPVRVIIPVCGLIRPGRLPGYSGTFSGPSRRALHRALTLPVPARHCSAAGPYPASILLHDIARTVDARVKVRPGRVTPVSLSFFFHLTTRASLVTDRETFPAGCLTRVQLAVLLTLLFCLPQKTMPTPSDSKRVTIAGTWRRRTTLDALI